MPAEWWQGFFSGLWLDVQRRFRAERTPAEADFIERVLQLRPQAQVLDVPCGEGRLSLELASRGYRLTGVDITPAVLEDARSKAAERNLQITWEQRDMRDLPWEGRFDGAFCFWGSFGYFDDAGNAQFLRAVARAPRPGARFVIDLPNLAEALLPRMREHDWWQVGDTLILEDRRYDHVRGCIAVEWTFVQDGKVEKKPSSMRVYTYREMCRLLEEAGFAQCEAYSSLDGEPFQLGKRVYLVATKRE